MKHNIGRWERVLRILLGGILVIAGWDYIALVGFTVVSVGLLTVGAVLIVTGIFAFCPANAVFHYNSCRHCNEGVTEKHLPV